MSIKVFDFFSGCGGTSKGFQKAGLEIVFALDNDPDAAGTFKLNFPDVSFIQKDINKVKTGAIKTLVESCGSALKLFCGCAPCQPFTKQKTKKPEKDNRVNLLNEFKRFVKAYNPEFVFIENVPGMQKIQATKNPFHSFVSFLKKTGYSVEYDVVRSQSYGVPQRRRRLVLLASRLGGIELPAQTHGPGAINNRYSTVREWISSLPAIEAGEEHPGVPNHRAARLSDKNFDRVKSTPSGCNRLSWPEHLKLACHDDGYTGHTDVYGRMKWDEPATGLTTRCISLSNGRFGHPIQNRAISVREAACLQTFPMDFIFTGSLNSMARQIGNAVPVKLAEVFGNHILNHMNFIFE